jgi:peptidyl-prolyl cis-trans isomerase SurA
MKLRFLIYSLFFASTLLTTSGFSQSESRVLFTIDDANVYSDEFSYIYKKNNSNNEDAFTREDINEYLDLFINFKLKVSEARRLGYDTTREYSEELDKYKDQLTKPYLTEKEVTDGLLEEAYDRMGSEIDVSHILISVGPDFSPEDTLRAFNKINEAWELASKGEDFSDLILKYSEEPFIEKTKGHIGYFTAMQMVYPFESAAYNTPVGEISKPFRTQFGYHILKVHDKRPSHGKVQISHIMLRFNSPMNSDDSTKLQNKVFEIFNLAKAGYDWDELCKENSEDLNSKDRGGALNPFGVGEMIPSIAEPAFSMTEVGEISDPVMSQYGWHILKLNGTKPLPSFDEYKSQLSRKIQRDSRSNKSKEALITRLKNENGFKENSAIKADIFSEADSSTLSGSWTVDTQNAEEWIFSLTDSVYTIIDFSIFVNENFKKAGAGHESSRIHKLYNLFVEEELIEYEKQHLEEKYEDYRYLMKEYREGILLFEIMENEVWAKSGSDSLGLQTFYQNNLDNYKVKESASLITFEVGNSSEVQNLINRLNQIVRDTTTSLENVKDLIKKEYPEIRVKIAGNFQEGDMEYSEWVSSGDGVYERDGSNMSEVTVIFDFKPQTYSELDQIKGIVISDYQDFLDKEWIDELKKKYRVKINKKELNTIYNSLVQ